MKKCKKINQLKNDKKGFTLIEIIIVIAIIGVLAAITVPSVQGYLDDSKQKADDATVEAIANATLSYLTLDGEPSNDADTREQAGVNFKNGILKYLSSTDLPQSKVNDAQFYVIIDVSANRIVISDGTTDIERSY
jgi:prepilin-type N-terminal cleavage/methylation domain-containing protein